MKITDIRIRIVRTPGKLKAVVAIVLDDEFVIHDIKVIEGDKGLFIAMPSRKTKDGEHRDIVHPINTESRDYMSKVILRSYEEAKKEIDE